LRDVEDFRVIVGRRYISFLAIGALVLTAAITGLIAFAVSGQSLTPPTPSLLKGAKASGGWWSGGCPPGTNEVAFIQGRHEARSPDVENQLARLFPVGTPEVALKLSLQRQGFKLSEACSNDSKIHRAVFTQKGGGLAGPYPIFASLAWKVDEFARIVWIKASIVYDGP
jgi:hypothetical protein